MNQRPLHMLNNLAHDTNKQPYCFSHNLIVDARTNYLFQNATNNVFYALVSHYAFRSEQLT